MTTETTSDDTKLGSTALFADLIEQWERRVRTANKLANDAAGSGDYLTHERCLTKAGTIRSMIVELKREISQANGAAHAPEEERP